MKKNLTIIGIIISTVVLAILSVMTAIRIKNLGTRPVAPSVPESKPKAEELIPDSLTPVPACKSTLQATALTPSPTPEVSLTPTATLTPGPSSTPTPGPSSTPTPGPSSTPGPGPYCDYLHADKANGNAPLTVNFEGKGYEVTRVKGFRFTFGDGEKKEFFGSYSSSQVQEVSHTYSQAGKYKAILEIMDDGDHWHSRPECEIAIEATAKGATATPGPTKIVKQPSPTEITLPVAGLKIPTLGGIIAGFLLISLGAALVF